ncbi:BolA family transcriptional regulator [Aquisalimonas sp.]|uniref:BolA family protein n=1 Tax=unclassified Aquisalimonas TaxID=2644645 RepID=UPI0025C22B82|nr:BolA family protein [Aquisalimonas sp.]
MTQERVAMIRQRLEAALPVRHIEIEDESHLHAGHAGAKDGGGHFRVLVVSDAFHGEPRIKRHRLVYDAMGDAMRRDTIHALSIRALTPDEHEGQSA